jgi:peptidoglycan/LPS O-acetylase OafA/YrhL
VKNLPRFAVLGVAEAIVLITCVLDLYTSTDLSSVAVLLRVLVAVAAVVVAVVAYHRWSVTPTRHTTASMVLGLLGGASLVSAVASASDGHVFGSDAMALIGAVTLVAAVAVTQVGLAQEAVGAPGADGTKGPNDTNGTQEGTR